MELLYRTDGGAHPQGKPRVYFCCHPAEQKIYLNKIAAMLQARQDCALWYPADGEGERDDAFFSDLTQMQLFVMPVTRLLLETDNPARLVDFAFAVKNHIPVLPLMEEAGLEDDFNRLCGSLQYLDPYSTDASAISYEEKLTKFLQEVLVGDEMAQRIRAEFAGRLFLSYRKKDRVKARRLMELIHRHEFCRDLAIWYDEFLVPGRNFNLDIRANMANSQLMALAVTPNLVNQENYVMTTEYPTARELGLPVLPLEVEKTSAWELSRCYPGLPRVVKAERENDVEKRLRKETEKFCKGTLNNTPEHQFLMGMAYLNGVDMEVNHRRALALISAAADAGDTEAMYQLHVMYSSGIAVWRDPGMAAYWLWRRCEGWKKKRDRSGTPEDAEYYLIVLHQYAAELREQRKMEEAEAVLRQLEEECLALLHKKTGWSEVQWRYVECLEQLGLNSELKGELKNALDRYQQMMEELEKLEVQADSEDDSERKREIRKRKRTMTLRHMGDIYLAQGNVDQAFKYFEPALKADEERMAENPTHDNRWRLSGACERMGNLHMQRGQHRQASSYYRRAATLIEQCRATIKNDQTQHGLALVQIKEVEALALQGRWDEAQQVLQSAKEHAAELLKKKNGRAERDLMAYYYVAEGRLMRLSGWKEEAESAYRAALNLYRGLHNESPTPKITDDLVTAYRVLVECLSAQEKFDEIQSLTEEAIRLAESLYKKTNSLEAMRVLILTWESKGDQEMKRKQIPMAMQSYRHALTRAEQITAQRRNLRSLQDLARMYEKIGKMLEANKSLSLAVDYCRKEAATRRELTEKLDTGKEQHKLYSSYSRLGLLLMNSGRYEEALQEFRAALEMLAKLENKLAAAVLQGDRQNTRFYMANALAALNRQEEARAAYQALLPEIQKRQQAQPTAQNCINTALCMVSLSRVQSGEEKRALLRQAKTIVSGLSEAHPTRQDYARLSKQIQAELHDTGTQEAQG